MARKEPAHRIPIGRIRAVIWENEDKEGRPWFNVEVVRTYRDGDEYRDSHSFSRDDLPMAAKALDMAFAWIWEQQMAVRSGDLDQ